MYYLAGPMTDPALRKKETYKDYYLRRNEKIAKKLEAAGVKVYLPQRDTNQAQTPRSVFLDNLKAIEKSKALVLLLSDTRGIYLEAGYAKSMGKKVVGLQVEETRALGTMVRNFVDHVANNVDELAILLKALEKKNRIKARRRQRQK
jgi:nucleoside 2-deoxyribosyltransferase